MRFHFPLLLVSLFRIMQGVCSDVGVTSPLTGFLDSSIKSDPPHPYAVSWTTQRECSQGTGADFYISQYGVKVCSAADTCIVWRPKDYHGTSLPCCLPTSVDDDVEDYSQVSLAIVTPPNLLGQWKKVQAGEISCGDAENQLATNIHS